CLPEVRQWANQLRQAICEDAGKRIPFEAYVQPPTAAGSGTPGFLSHWAFPSAEAECFTDILYLGCHPVQSAQRIEQYLQHLLRMGAPGTPGGRGQQHGKGQSQKGSLRQGQAQSKVAKSNCVPRGGHQAKGGHAASSGSTACAMESEAEGASAWSFCPREVAMDWGAFAGMQLYVVAASSPQLLDIFSQDVAGLAPPSELADRSELDGQAAAVLQYYFNPAQPHARPPPHIIMRSMLPATSEMSELIKSSLKDCEHAEVSELEQEVDVQRKMHDAFEKILDGLELAEADMNDLEHRGLLEHQIKQVGFKTWPGGSMSVPTMGAWRWGLGGQVRVYVQPSLLIPARNPEGLITGLHNKPHRKRGNDASKYMWVSVQKSFKLHTGGSPLFCCWYDWSPASTVALIEGGLKAYVFAHLAGRMKVIGAVGGQFWQSPSELLHALARFEATRVVLFPDAGSTRNKCVILDYFRTFRLLRSWGFQVGVAWWGQHDKQGDADADDLLVGMRIEEFEARMVVLSIQDFWHQVDGNLQHQLLHSRHFEVFSAVGIRSSSALAITPLV
ncbi:unnamed protein product, partial [Prorocentrum cordatum]